MYSKGPIIKSLEILSVVSGLIAVAALIISLTAQSNRIDYIQQSRQRSALDSCNILRTILFKATPPARYLEASHILKQAGLSNCVQYAHDVRYSK